MRTVILCFSVFLLVSCESSKDSRKEIKDKILFIVSNQHTYGDTKINTANHFGEIVLAYDVLIKNGYQVDFVSPKGGAIPIGYLNTSDSIQKYYLYDSNFMNKLKNTKTPNQVNSLEYRAVYYGGGGAAMFGVPEDKSIQKISTDVYNSNGIISSICHGTAGIVNLKIDNDNYLYANKDVNGFPDLFENKSAQYYKTFPFSIEEIIKERGGKFSYSKNGWDNYFKVDGRLITGQDPTAAASVANEIIKKLKTLKK
ncbi:type 1 glutamine amidotransferase domain-containing protein [Pseudotenacibaculum sp. MALMAid0570]|uniref:type 1 glutamine amidotransferase domain-containing protein n=1 Tax=Pseudotenacibaculum sp. MALMAid0570 TaxID=3143938 RepID=UPI0032DE7FA0